MIKKACLYIVPTPLGNIDDLSPRARYILDNVDYIAAEDTRKAARLLSEANIGNKLLSYYEQNAREREFEILSDLIDGEKSIALISDAGTPCISDPGSSLVVKAIENRINIVSLPGPSAILTSLAASGLDPSRFIFYGFVPGKDSNRDDFIAEMMKEKATVVFFESPHHLEATLDSLVAHGLGSRRISIARELTKEYEEFLYFTVKEAAEYFSQVLPRGEFTLVLEGVAAFQKRTGQEAERYSEVFIKDILQKLIDDGSGTKQAAKIVSYFTDIKQSRLYDLTLELEKKD